MKTQKESKMPLIRFKGFETEWSNTTFRTSCSLLTGQPFQSKKFSKSGVFLVRGMNVKRGYVDNSSRISEFWPSANGLESFLLKLDDIVIQMDGALIGSSYGKIKQQHLPALLVQRVTRARCEGISNSDYIYQYIERDFLKYIRTNKTETAVPHLSLDDIRNFPISITSPCEQTKLGEYFRELDGLIVLYQLKHDKLVTLKKAMLQKMFPQAGAKTPQIRFKGFEGVWMNKKLGDVFTYERPDPYIVNSSEYSNEYRTPVLTANKAFILGYTNETRTFDRPCIVFDDFTLEAKFANFPFMVKSSAIKLLTIQDIEVNDLYFAFLTLRNAKIEIMGHARHYIGVVQPTPVIMPEIAEQQKIGTYFRTLDELISKHATQLQKLKQIKTACLEKMFV